MAGVRGGYRHLVILLKKELLKEHQRQLLKLPHFQATKGLHNLSYEDVLDAHFCIADFFAREGHGMGGVGIKDVNTFVSTIERQFSGYDGHVVFETPYEQIATLVFGIIRNHPFHDANKRTAFLCALMGLHKMGRVICVSEKEFEDLMVDVADRNLERKSAVRERIKKGESHPDIRYLGRYLEKNSRKKARLTKTIKFRQLRQIVEQNGFSFSSSNKGTIDLLRRDKKVVHRFFFGDRIETTETVLLNIAYHGEGVDVPDNTLRLVRQACGLTDQDGYDGEVLLRDAQPTFTLINSYRAALQRLAFR